MRAFPLVITALALSACAGSPLEWNATETGCEGYDYQPTDPTLSIRQDGGSHFLHGVHKLFDSVPGSGLDHDVIGEGTPSVFARMSMAARRHGGVMRLWDNIPTQL